MFEVLWQTQTGRVVGPRLSEATLVAPELLDAEVAAALRRRVLRADTTREEAELAIAVLGEWDIERISHRELAAESMRWWANVSAYDALYVAAAAIRRATLLTADGPLSRAPVRDVAVENVRVGPPA